MRLGFVGAGRMGRPMVARLVAAGHEVRVLGRSDVVAPEEDAVVICVLTDQQVRDVAAGLPKGTTVVVHTTCSPSTVAHLEGQGLDVVDAPVSGGPPDVEAGRITLFVGGAEAAVERVRPVLGAYGDPVLHVGAAGAGQRVKLINNALFAAQLGLLVDAAALATQWTVDEAVLLNALRHGSSAGRALLGASSRGSATTFTRSIADFLAKDLAVVRAEGADLGCLAPAMAALPLSSAELSS